jgi:SPP1 gp7 family putative phage head morphogenesis protein
VAVLRQRAQNRRLRSKPKVRAAAFPKAVELRYTQALVGEVRSAKEKILTRVRPLVEQARPAGVPTAELLRAIESLRPAIVFPAERLAHAAVSNIEAFATNELNEIYAPIIGLPPFKAIHTDSLEDAIARKLRENVRLIESIPSELLSQVEEELRAGFEAGARVESFYKVLEERFNVAESRAKLIARDQTGKINAAITEERNRSIGILEYTWQTSQDERVRGNPGGLWPKGLHWQLHGKTFRYDQPPVTNLQGDANNPGEDYQCRCNALANVEGALSALGI